MLKLSIILLLVFAQYVVYTFSVSYPQLRLLSVIFRHGDREPNDSASGDLTLAGRLRAYRLGEALRARYGQFLGDVYEPRAVWARSTAYARAKMSVQLTLAALYPPRRHQNWHESLAWQPIPYSYVSRREDVLLFPKDCPRFLEEFDRIQSSSEFQKVMAPYRELLVNLTIETGDIMKSAYDMFLLYHKLSSIRSMNQTLPGWASEIFPDGLLLNGTYLAYDALKRTDWMRRVNGGTLMRKMVDDMVSKTDDDQEDEWKIFLYSAHELNIVAVLQTLKIWEPHIPEYSSAIIVELREDRKNYYVKILYNRGIPSIFIEMQIPGCQNFCPLSKFIELISDQLPSYEEIICRDKPVQINTDASD